MDGQLKQTRTEIQRATTNLNESIAQARSLSAESSDASSKHGSP
jgi:hypothetical protein